MVTERAAKYFCEPQKSKIKSHVGKKIALFGPPSTAYDRRAMMSSQEASTSTLTITLELGGGTEFLTATKKTKKHVLKVPARVSAGEFVKHEGIQPAVVEAATLNGKATASDADAAEAKAKHAATMQDFIQLVCRDLIVERQGMLVEPDGSLRPGILVLINDADWELEGEMEYELQDGDHICLISTLHGG